MQCVSLVVWGAEGKTSDSWRVQSVFFCRIFLFLVKVDFLLKKLVMNFQHVFVAAEHCARLGGCICKG